MRQPGGRAVFAALAIAGVAVLGAIFWFLASSTSPDQAPGQALGSVVSDGTLPITQDGSTLDLEFCANADPQQSNSAVRTVVLVVHGSSRNACDYATYAVASASDAEELDSTLVVAPRFAAEGDLSDSDPQTLYWADSSDGWKSGDQSLTSPLDRPWTVSSFAAMDQLLSLVDDTARFPNLARVVVTGHSAGGQFVNRYAIGSPGLESGGDVPVRYVVMNPSSYLYLTDQRFIDGVFRPLTDEEAAGCPGYDRYKYGMADRNEYMSTDSETTMVDRFVTRDVVYLLGEDDTDPEDDSLDTGCEAEWQGAYRLERGTRYFQALLVLLGPKVENHQRLATVPGVGHDGHDMIDSREGQSALFGR